MDIATATMSDLVEYTVEKALRLPRGTEFFLKRLYLAAEWEEIGRRKGYMGKRFEQIVRAKLALKIDKLGKTKEKQQLYQIA